MAEGLSLVIHPRTMATVEERLARIEGGYEHVATKADLERMKSDLIRWTVGVMLAGLTAAVGLTAVVVRVVGG